MEQPYLVDKPLGATPLEALTAFRDARGLSPSVKLAYAGRLDPLATGLLPILHGPLLARQEEYWYLAKQYEVSVLLGLSTDSYDLLGLPRAGSDARPDIERISATVRGLVGKIDLSVPIYSSQRVDGKALFALARESDAGPVVVPVRRMTISQIDILGISELDAASLLTSTLERIGLVRGDFRQDAICVAWEECLREQRYFPVVRLSVHCASGTYIRSLSHEIGKRLGCGAVVADLRRVRVGPWRITDPDVIGISLPR